MAIYRYLKSEKKNPQKKKKKKMLIKWGDIGFSSSGSVLNQSNAGPKSMLLHLTSQAGKPGF